LRAQNADSLNHPGTPKVKEKELRLALVCFGGVSLVLYMHGVIKEVLKLARASKAFHETGERQRQEASFAALTTAKERECDSEEAYFSLLKAIGEKLELRVVVDSVAGASAGGISGIILARALAHDLSIDHLREMWLEEADVLRLLAPKQRARPWNKWLLYPVLWILFRLRILGLVTDREIRRKLSTFFRSRWFEPPFDGDRFLSLLLEGMRAMRRAPDTGSSLLPPGHALDLAVTVTDMFGYPRRLYINSPTAIQEREQALLWSFTFCRWADGSADSDLDDDNLPGLAMAARATSSFPGVFPPAQLGDVDRLLGERAVPWPHRARFMEDNFADYARSGIDPAKTSFLDGSIANNKPFAAAIKAIRERPALREVDRRIVYIDPDPERPAPPPDGRAPGFLHTLKAALSDIPAHEPVYGELARIAGHNKAIAAMKAVLEAARPQIDQLVSAVIGNAGARANGARAVQRWREAANALSARQANYAYQVYARLKARIVLEHVTQLAGKLAGLDAEAPARAALAAAIDAWGLRRGALPPQGMLPAGGSVEEGSHPAPWIDFLLHFDIDFRRRRLSFLIRALNSLYARLGEAEFGGLEPGRIDELKRALQRPLQRLRTLISGEFAFAGIRARLAALAAALAAAPEAALRDRIDDIMDQLADELNLRAVDHELDEITGSSLDRSLPRAFRHEIILHYIGFPFWDVLTFTLPEWRDMGEHDEIRVDRISPLDAQALHLGAEAATLKGADLRHFAGFLSRPMRESDYLRGRLDGAERLIDIVCDCARGAVALAPRDIERVKHTAFRSILDAEARFLDANLIATTRAALDRALADDAGRPDSPGVPTTGEESRPLAVHLPRSEI
jgi:patatin-related protein